MRRTSLAFRLRTLLALAAVQGPPRHRDETAEGAPGEAAGWPLPTKERSSLLTSCA
jgi:hypothetical protein